ncbi:hypothetical protein EZV62_013474 [Acer yangbiense]|uniref:Endonuclease/exonuclease/phosphatase domain-containing protein n=1 Tax=Acer yangbiense TaxID=1000413 RepID=A0A5C7HYB2_9ROSI|nr:hypothetical protein EZV62_013474 [Acer yangbiense]
MSRSLRIHFLAIMSSRSTYRGGRNQWRRSFSERPYNNEGGRGHFVSGDSHIRSVRDSNLDYRQGNFSNQTPPPPHLQFRQPPPHPQLWQPPPHPQFRQPPPHPQFRQPPPYNRNPQFRPQPPPFVQNQVLRPRPPKPLDYRNWEHAKAAPPPGSDRFLVLSYNILADYLAISHRSSLYFHIPRYILDWQWRKKSILFELGLWSADIMCLQEVDRFQDLEEELKDRGYNGIWKMRTGNAIDGCAIFWRTSRFKLLFEESIEFNKLGLRDNVAQICVLELSSQNHTENTAALPTSSAPCNKVVVCNIHVLYNPRRGEIKLGQVRTLLDRAHAVSKIWDDAPVVLCGDFNCTPKSPLYNLISEQKLDLSGVDRDKVSGQASAEIRASKPYNPNSSAQTNDGSIQTPSVVGGGSVDIQPGDPLSDMQKHNKDGNAEVFPSVNNLSPPQSTETVLGGSYKDHASTSEQSESNINKEDERTDGDDCTCPLVSNDQPSTAGCNPEIIPASSSEISSTELSCLTCTSDAIEVSVGSLGKNSSQSSADDKEGNYSTTYQNEVSNEAAVEGGSIHEDENTFLSALHNTEDAFPPETVYDPSSHSEGLQTVRVLAPIPKHAMQWTPGFPTKVKKNRCSKIPKCYRNYDILKWGSDHIALASEDIECDVLFHVTFIRSTIKEVRFNCAGTFTDENLEGNIVSYNLGGMGCCNYLNCNEKIELVSVVLMFRPQCISFIIARPIEKENVDVFPNCCWVAFLGRL